MATFHKLPGKSEYEVKQDGKTIGYFYRYYEKSTGRWAAHYVGHFPGGYFWCFDPEDVGAPGFFRGVSFKEGKKRLIKEFPEKKDPPPPPAASK